MQYAPAGGRLARWALVAASAASLVTLIVLAAGYRTYQRRAYSRAKSHVVSVTNDAAKQIDAQLRDIMDTVNGLALQYKNHIFFDVSPGELLIGHNKITDAMYVKRNGDEKSNKVDLLDISSINDSYGNPQRPTVKQIQSRFEQAAKRGGGWIDPWYCPIRKKLIVSYVAPLKRPARGFVAADISIESLAGIVRRLDLGAAGYGALTSKSGMYIYHPNMDLVRRHRTILQAARELHDADRARINKDITRGGSGVIDHKSTTTGLKSWLVYRPVPSAKWSLQTTFLKNEVEINRDRLRRQLMWISFAACTFVFFAAAVALHASRGGAASLWALSLVATLLPAAGVGYIWYLTLAFEPRSRGVVIADTASLENFTRRHREQSRRRHDEPPVFVPTGLYIQSMKFTSGNEIAFRGYIWQKYDSRAHRDLSRGFIFPEAESLSIEEAYRRKNGSVETLGWSFRGTLRVAFDHAAYPLDRERVWLRVWPKDFARNVVLTPDLESYKLLNPAALPGLERGMKLKMWSIRDAFFEYHFNSYDTDFGIKNYVGQDKFPELYYNVSIQRNFMDAFLSRLTPVLVISVMLFGMMIIATRDPERRGFTGWSVSSVLTFGAAQFFVVILSHIDLRAQFSAGKILYLEYFYFLMYLSIIWVVINALLYTFDVRFPLIRARDNLYPKLLYWPVILNALYVITFVKFF